MRRKDAPSQEFLSSTTRAVAWGALFFSLLAFLISMATLFLTWRDGQLVKNSRLLLDGLDKAVQTWSDNREAAPSETGGNVPELPLGWERIREKVDRLGAMVDAGDDRARYYLDNLVEELGPLRDHTSAATSQWVGQTVETLRSTRDKIRENAPEAARSLKAHSLSMRSQSSSELAAEDETAGEIPKDESLNLDLDLEN